MISAVPLPQEPCPTLSEGEILAGRYRTVCCLGQGAVGEVYQAEDLELGGRLAVKVLRPDIAHDERMLRRFKQEIQLARRVTHPNVCRTYDLVYHRDLLGTRVFLTMELLRGETLEDRLARRGRLATAEALPIALQVVDALSAAHAAGVVHRDLKTSNVFLVDAHDSPGGARAVVTDFGFAWSLEQEEGVSDPLTATGELVGSPAYMAPEQVRGEKATPASDIYALGVVLYEVVTGELPFLGKSAFYTALKRLQEAPPPPRGRVPDLDPAWESVILRCLEREPEDRFASLDEVARALSGSPAAPAARPKPEPWPASSPAPSPWSGLAACLVFLLAGTLALLVPRVEVSARLGGHGEPRILQETGRAGLMEELQSARRRYDQVRFEVDARKIASALRDIGRIQLELGQTNEARQMYQRSFDISRELGDEEGVASSVTGLADVDRAAGDLAAARAGYEEALAIFRRRGARSAEAAMLQKLDRVRAVRRERLRKPR